MRYRNGLVAVGLIGTVLAGSACGVPSSKAVKATGGSASGAATTSSVAPGTTSTATGATSTTSGTTSTISGSDPTTTPAVSTGPLKGKLLTLADLPSGWTKGTNDSPDTSSDSGSDSGGSTNCSTEDPTAAPLASLPDRAKVEFDKGVSGASSLTDLHLFQEQLARGTVAEVSAAYADLVSGVDRCTGKPFADSGTTVVLRRKTVPTSADESVTWVSTSTSNEPADSSTTSFSGSLKVDLLVARKGNTLLLLFYSPDTEGDAELSACAAKALAKL
jgi:hypothetical protein